MMDYTARSGFVPVRKMVCVCEVRLFRVIGGSSAASLFLVADIRLVETFSDISCGIFYRIFSVPPLPFSWLLMFDWWELSLTFFNGIFCGIFSVPPLPFSWLLTFDWWILSVIFSVGFSLCVAGATVGLILERRHPSGGEDGCHEQAFHPSGAELENGFKACFALRGW